MRPIFQSLAEILASFSARQACFCLSVALTDHCPFPRQKGPLSSFVFALARTAIGLVRLPLKTVKYRGLYFHFPHEQAHTSTGH